MSQLYNLTVQNLLAPVANIGSLSGGTAYFTNINSSGTTSALNAANANVGALTALQANVAQANVQALQAQTAVFNSVNTVIGNTQNLTVGTANVTVLNAQQANVQSLTGQTASFTTITSTGNTGSLTAAVGNLTAINAQQANIQTLTGQTASFTTITSTGNAGSLTAAVGNLTTINAQQANIQTLTGQTASFTTITSTGNTGSLTAAVGNLTTINAQQANIQSLVGQTASFTTITSTGNTGSLTAAVGNLTAINSQQANIVVLNAQTSTLGNVLGPLNVLGDIVLTGNLRQTLFGNTPGGGYPNYVFGNLAASNIAVSTMFTVPTANIGTLTVGNLVGYVAGGGGGAAQNLYSISGNTLNYTYGNVGILNCGIAVHSGNLVMQNGNQLCLSNTNTINFGYDVAGKEVNAGRVGYGTFSGGGGSLDVVGVGNVASQRRVQILDGLVVSNYTAGAGNGAVVAGTAQLSGNVNAAAASITGTTAVGALTAGTLFAGNISTAGAVTYTTVNPGDMAVRAYGAVGDRYGIGQYNNGTQRLFTSSAFGPATVNLSLASTDGGGGSSTLWTDLLTASQSSVVVNRPLQVVSSVAASGNVNAAAASITGALTASTAGIGTFTGNPTFSTNQLFEQGSAPGFFMGSGFSSGQAGYIVFNNSGAPSGTSTLGLGVTGMPLGTGLSVNANGNVGIGQSQPAYLLDVGGTGRVNGQLLVTGTSNVALISSTGGVNISGTNGLNFGFDNTTKDPNAGVIGYQRYSTSLDIIGAGTGPPSRSVRIWEQLGVGMNPSFALDVSGTGRFSGNVNATAASISGPVTIVGNVVANGYTQIPPNNQGDWIYTNYTPTAGVVDRYGIGQYNNGKMKMFASSYIPFSAVSLSLSGSDTQGGGATFTDLLTASNNAVLVTRPLQVASNVVVQGGNQLCLSNTNTINFGYDVSGKEVNAGRVGYGTFSGGGGSLDVVGVGNVAGQRRVQILDGLVVSNYTAGAGNGSIQAGTAQLSGNVNAAAASITGTLTASTLSASTAGIATYTGNPTFSTNFMLEQGSAPGFFMGSSTASGQAGYMAFNNAGPPSGASTLGFGVTGMPGGGVSISTTGNVGIGQSQPAYLLDVGGTTRLSGNVVLGGYTQIPPNNQGDWIYTNYTPNAGVVDRYGIGQYNNGKMKMFASSYIPFSAVSLSLSSSDTQGGSGSFTDLLTASNNAVLVTRPLQVASNVVVQGGNQLCLSNTNTINFGYDVSGKEVNAGRVGYGTFSGGGGSLDVVGVGNVAGQRRVQILDGLVVSNYTAGAGNGSIVAGTAQLSGNVNAAAASINGPVTLVGNVLTTGYTQITPNNQGDWVYTNYTPNAGPSDRYGIGQYNNGKMKMFASSYIPFSAVSLSLASTDTQAGGATFTDLVTASNTAVVVSRPLQVGNCASLSYMLKGLVSIPANPTLDAQGGYQVVISYGQALPDVNYAITATITSTGNYADWYTCSITNKTTTGATCNMARLTGPTNPGAVSNSQWGDTGLSVNWILLR